MKKTILSIVIITAVFFLQSCGDNNPASSEKDNNTLYFNSFETDSDTAEWTGLSKEMLVDDPCPENGKRSLHIGGGCIQPAASIELSSVPAGEYKLSLWGKMGQVSQTAQVKLMIKGSNGEGKDISVAVNGDSWKSYTAEGTLQVAAGEKLTLEIWVGGIVFADVYLDNLKIEKISSVTLVGSTYKSVINMFK